MSTDNPGDTPTSAYLAVSASTTSARVTAPDTHSPLEGSAHRDVLRRVREVMTELPAKQQAVLHLRVFEEMSYAAIAAALDLTPRSARVYLVKARAHLRGRLGREIQDR